MKEVVIVSAVRTPIGSIGGTLKDVQPEVLAKTVIEGAIDKIGLDKALIGTKYRQGCSINGESAGRGSCLHSA
ncbi:MAG: 3-ketoacyl-CoA thiolase [Anaerosporomusa subterranea]|nr:3-ketoacyl-CoA thiolase [Anaerosporomusa subterranea]